MPSAIHDQQDCDGGAIVWAFGCAAVLLAIGVPVYLIFFA